MNKSFRLLIVIVVLCCGRVLAQVSPAMPPPNRNMTGPSPHRPSGGDHPETTAGTIEGFVYWNANTMNHIPANSCTGLAITVSVGSSSGGPLTSYTPLSTLSNNFKYVGQVKEFLAGGKIDIYDVCTYGYDKVPVGPPLQVKLTVTQPTAFSPVATPEFEILGPITIINGQCNMLPRIVNPIASDLAAHWGSCQNMAYDVNFVMQNPHVPGLSHGTRMPSGSGNVRVEANSGPSGSPLLKGSPGPAESPMLPGSPQQGMLARGTSSTTQAPSTPGRLQENRGQAPPAITDGTRQTYTGTTGTVAPQTLTNAEVAGMLKAGLAESVIISSIRSARKNFDFSSAGCHALQQARVSMGILNAMGDGSVRPCREITGPGGKAELNPQSPPGSKTGPANSTALKPIKLAPPKAFRKVTNPRSAQQNASIIAVLEQQRQAASQEAAAMKLSVRSVASAASERAPAAIRFQGSTSVQNLGPETTQSEGKLASSIAHAPAFNSIVLACSHDSTPRIIQLSGGEGHGIFTPEAKYNLYTITGCSFGQSGPGNSAYIFGLNGFKANLNIDFWSDNGITAHLDPWLAGVLDQDNVTLVVAPAGKQPFDKSGYKFYAARGMPAPDGSDQEVQVANDSMPQASVSLFNANPVLAGYNQVPPNGTSQFPSFSFQGTPVSGWVFRYAYGHLEMYSGLNGTDCFINDIGYPNTDPPPAQCGSYFGDSQTLGSDTWDFSKLAPGFVISSYNLYYEDPDPTELCGSWDDYRKNSGLLLNWDFNLTAPTQISVTWPLYWCQDTELPPSGRINDQKQSVYGLAVWVLGPRCVDPWTGQKNQSCMNSVKQTLS